MRKRLHFCTASLWAGSLLATLMPAYAAVNSLTISEKAGVTTTNYPVQIGRPFVKGEISGFPQALVNGTAVSTQADVKQRWNDGSVKHAIVSFLIPTLSSGSTVTVTFRNQSACNCGAGSRLTKAQMLDAAYNFDARMELTSGSMVAASARTMLNSDSFSYWLEGDVATSVIIADHSSARAHDIGFTSHRSFRPIFHATFWPGSKKVRIRFIGESANMDALQNMTYGLVLKTGSTSPAQVYSKSQVTHPAASRWTKEFWIGGAPPAVSINHNLAYLRDTKFTFNYDTSKALDASAATAGCNSWNSASKDLYGTGEWTMNMAAAGGRPDIGPYPAWVVRWLYSGDKCLTDAARGNADLSGAWPYHFRETKTNKPFNRGDAGGTAIGRVLSIAARPTTKLSELGYSGTTAEDRMTLVGGIDNLGWVYDPAHEPDPASIVYALTGDFWYLEEMWFLASAGAAHNYPGPWERGPTGAYGVPPQVQIRGAAWVLRNRVHTAFISPDGSPEKQYFETLINDAIATDEGIRNITGTPFQGNTSWNWGRNTMAAAWGMGANVGLPPLRQWRRGEDIFVQPEYGVNTSTTSLAISLFEQNFMMLALGRGKELGYAFGPLVTWLAPQYVNIVTDASFNPYISANGRMPTVRKSDGKYFDSWANLKTGYASAWQTATNFIPTGQTENLPPNGYTATFVAATSMVKNEQGGSAAWTWVASKILTDPTFNSDPKWAIVPSGTVSSTPPPANPASSCDLNGDGVVNSVDVQSAINQTLAVTGCTTADLDANGKCNVVDVQRTVNASLGQPCRVGP